MFNVPISVQLPWLDTIIRISLGCKESFQFLPKTLKRWVGHWFTISSRILFFITCARICFSLLKMNVFVLPRALPSYFLHLGWGGVLREIPLSPILVGFELTISIVIVPTFWLTQLVFISYGALLYLSLSTFLLNKWCP
jgi:hypothetical protein